MEKLTGLQRKTLNMLLDRYENSRTYTGENKVNQTFRVMVKDIWPEYLDDFTDIMEVEEFKKQVEQLEKSSLIYVQRKKNDEIFSNKYKQNNNIYDILYSYAEIYNNKKKNKINENNNNYVITDINSNKIFEKKKLKIFSYIFNKLDSCNEGSINILNMDLKKLPISIINILNPIFKEIKESDEKISKINFIEGCFKLFDDLDYNQKNTILNYGNEISNKINNNKNFNNNFSFHPVINNNSIKINNEIILNEFNTNKIKKNEEEFDSSY